MKLIYQGKNGEFLNGVPARDLEPHEIQAVADMWQKSLAETEGILISRGLYKVVSEEKPKMSKKVSEDDGI